MSPTVPALEADVGGQSEPPEGELARFFGYSRDVLVILDGGGRVLVISPSVERVLGYAIQELMGERFFHWVHPDDQALVKEQSRALVAGRPIPDLDARIQRSDGTWVEMRWSLSVGSSHRIYGVGRDRTAELRRREALLSQELAELRLRTAMELHDGILQTLTGASFQIATARRLLRRDPAAAESVLEALARSVSAEQQEMRLYVDEVKGGSQIWTGRSAGIAGRVVEMLERVELIWGLRTVPDIVLPDTLSPETGRRVLRIVQEAAVNAARHGGAKSIRVDVRVEGHEIHVRAMDDGHGFSFLGDYDDAALREKRLGPLALKHRVAAAGGRISIRSTPQGATLSVSIPLVEEDTK